jgi:uncharacterized surface anchored protein
MRRLAFLAAFSMMALFVFAPAAVAQDEVQEEFVEEVAEIEPAEPVEPLEEEAVEAQQEAAAEQQFGEEKVEVEDQKVIPKAAPPPPPKAAPPPPPKAAPPPPPKAKAEKAKEMPKTGGVSLTSALLPAAGLLLVGSGVMVLAALRRR